jgi:hypothetical protein
MAATDDLGSAMRDLPSPPFISIPGLPNFRDAGGYEVASDPPNPASSEGNRKIKMIKRGILFRSSEPSKLTDAGAAYLSQQLGIRLVYDLRSAVEISRGYSDDRGFPIREWEGSERKFVPVFLDQDYSPEAIALRYKNYASESDQVWATPVSVLLQNFLLFLFPFLELMYMRICCAQSSMKNTTLRGQSWPGALGNARDFLRMRLTYAWSFGSP